MTTNNELQGVIDNYDSEIINLTEQLIEMEKPKKMRQIVTKHMSRYTNEVRK